MHCPGDLIPLALVQDCILWKIFDCHRIDPCLKQEKWVSDQNFYCQDSAGHPGHAVYVTFASRIVS